MSEDGILKHSLSGGYKDLIQTLDSALDENNRKLRELEDHILFLTKEKAQSYTGSQPGVRPEAPGTGENKAQFGLLKPVNQDAESRRGKTIAQLMDLSEGTYLVSEDHSLLNLPDPAPVYRTKEKNAGYPVTATKPEPLQSRPQQRPQPVVENVYSRTPQIEPPVFENVYSRSQKVEQPAKKKSIFRPFKKEPIQEAAYAKPAYEQTTYREQAYAEEAATSFAESERNNQFAQYGYSSSTDDVAALKAELSATRAELKKVCAEKKELSAKLQYSTELLLKIYKG